jgi:hypothetical protein
MDPLKSWMDTHTQATHWIAFVGTGLVAAYLGYSPFHELVNHGYAAIPPAARTLLGTAGFLVAWYRNGQKTGGQ